MLGLIRALSFKNYSRALGTKGRKRNNVIDIAGLNQTGNGSGLVELGFSHACGGVGLGLVKGFGGLIREGFN